MKVLITGITGMIGVHFRDAGKDKNWTVYGLARNSASSRLENPSPPNMFRCDILDRDGLEEVFKTVKPDLVIHLAAQAFNGESWKFEETTHAANINGTRNVLNACRKIVPKAKIMLACSSAEYGDFSEQDCPLDENHVLRPVTPYGVSKVATESLGYQFAKNYRMPIYLPRLFNHIGTMHPPATAIQNFARQLALISKKKTPNILYCGDLETSRDFIDVRDGVAGMMLLLEKGRAAEPVNICTGHAHKIGDILNMLIDISGCKVKVQHHKDYERPSDEPVLVGDNSKLRKLGWKQQYTIQQTLKRVYNDWLSRT